MHTTANAPRDLTAAASGRERIAKPAGSVGLENSGFPLGMSQSPGFRCCSSCNVLAINIHADSRSSECYGVATLMELTRERQKERTDFFCLFGRFPGG